MRLKTCKDCGEHFKTMIKRPAYCNLCKRDRELASRMRRGWVI
tara:strand:- start:260 stop:388 length:129 start_codon:yes stop_codon:yes gene_type:complete